VDGYPSYLAGSGIGSGSGSDRITV
jgi:hypothetical protein